MLLQGYQFRVTPLGTAKTVTISGLSLYLVIFTVIKTHLLVKTTVTVAG